MTVSELDIRYYHQLQWKIVLIFCPFDFFKYPKQWNLRVASWLWQRGRLSELWAQNYPHTTVVNTAFPFFSTRYILLYLFSGIKEHVSLQQPKGGIIMVNSINWRYDKYVEYVNHSKYDMYRIMNPFIIKKHHIPEKQQMITQSSKYHVYLKCNI